MTVPAVDTHTHFWPRGMLAAAAEGSSWYGWRPLREADGRTLFAVGSTTVAFPPPAVDLDDPQARIARRREQQGIEFEAVMVVGFLWNYHLDAETGARYCREINTELAELERNAPGHYRGLAQLPLQDRDASLRELDHAVTELGLRHFAVTTAVNGRNLDDPQILPVLQAMAEADVTVSVHPAFFDKLGAGDRLSRYYFMGSFAAPVEASIGLMSVIHCGLLDEYPQMRLWFTHGGGVAQHSIGRFAHRWRTIPPEQRTMARAPDEYLRGTNIYYDCIVHDELTLQMVLQRVGADQITIGTDYPFSWDNPGGSAHWIRGATWLSQEDKEKILWRNAVRFLELDTAALPWVPAGAVS